MLVQVREAVEEESTGGAFPLLVAVKGVEVDIRKAKSSRPEDKQKILHLIAGTPEDGMLGNVAICPDMAHVQMG